MNKTLYRIYYRRIVDLQGKHFNIELYNKVHTCLRILERRGLNVIEKNTEMSGVYNVGNFKNQIEWKSTTTSLCKYGRCEGGEENAANEKKDRRAARNWSRCIVHNVNKVYE